MQPPESTTGRRQQLRDDIVDLLRTYAVGADRVAHAFADSQGLHPTDLQALIAVMHAERRGDPLTPGRLGAEVGLSSGATTAVIDRLERLGHLRRTREHSDRRRIHLRYADAGMALAVAFFGPLGRRTDAVVEKFTDAELDTVRRFLAEITTAMREHGRAVRGED